MVLPLKLEGGFLMVVGIWAAYSNLTDDRGVRQVNFDPISQTESINLKATKLKRFLLVAACIGVIGYGLVLLIR